MIPIKKLQNGFELPVYGLGLWEIGGRHCADYSQDASAIEAIQAALASGITHFDVAESYGAGHAEELLGKAIEGVSRQKLRITTKVAAENQDYSSMLYACERSLKRLGVDYLDLYLLHHPGLASHRTGALRALNELIMSGVVKHWGVCNLHPNLVEKIATEISSPLLANQVHYNVQIREAEYEGVLHDCIHHDRFLIAWRPLQKGAILQSPLLNRLAQKYAKTPAQIALNWLIAQKNVIVIAKTSNPKHLIDNLGALFWQMEDSDLKLIQREYPGQKNVSDIQALYR